MRSWLMRVVVMFALTGAAVASALPKDPDGWQYRGWYCDHSEHEKWLVYENEDGELIEIYGGTC